MASITLNNIKKVYGGKVTAVESMNLHINDKEFIVLVGPSGCGKSTALRMIAGLEDITEGELFIDDKVVNGVDPKDRNIAMVFQNYALYPHMNVYKNMEFGLKIRKMKKEERKIRIERTAKMLQIEDLLDRKPAELSGGQRQRVALGRAMVREPDIFLLDEPLSNLDAKLRAEMRITVGKLHRNLQTTFLYVTHDQTEAMTMADRIVVMNNGHIQQVDDPVSIYRYPANLFVAKFIGSPQINSFYGEIGKVGGGYFLKLWGREYALPSGRFSESALDGAGGEVIACFRPEDLSYRIVGGDVSQAPEAFGLIAEVELVEDLGAESYIYARFGEERVVLKTSHKSRVFPGALIELSLQLERMHLFDRVSEISLLHLAEI